MKKANSPQTDELRPDYRRDDFVALTRGKYAKRCQQSSNVVVIAPEVQKAFPNAKSVNDALRGLLDLAHATGLSAKPARAAKIRDGLKVKRVQVQP